MTDLALYQKDQELRRRLNAFFRDTFDLPDLDYYGRFDLKELLSLKSVLSDINNALTMLVVSTVLSGGAVPPVT